ncbi:MAG: hypothetical protein AB3N13_09630 [Arenibacterium sp.]
MKDTKTLLEPTRFQRPSSSTQKPKTTATWEGVEVVEYFQKHGLDIPETGPFSKTFHYRKIKELGIKLYHAEKIVEIVRSRVRWLREEKGKELHTGKWLTKRYAEMKELGGVDAFIRKNS